MSQRWFNQQSGMSMVELLIVSGVMALVAVTSASLIFPFFHMTSQVRENLTNTVDNDLAQRVLTAELRRSFLMRNSNITCGQEIDAIFKTNVKDPAQAPFFDLRPNFAFSFFTAPVSTVTSRDPKVDNVVYVTDPRQFPEKALVVAMDPTDSSRFEFFKVSNSDLNTRKLTLVRENLNTTDTTCDRTGVRYTLPQLFENSGGNTLMLHRVRIVTYLRTEGEPKRLMKSMWPESSDAMAMDLVLGMRIKATWQPYGDELDKSKAGYIERGGKWTGTVVAQVEIPSLVKRSESSEVNNKKAVLRTRNLESRAVFDLSSTVRLNRNSRTTASDLAVTGIKMPTCGVIMSASPVSLAADIDPTSPIYSKFANTKTYLLEASVSESNISGVISVTLITSGDGYISCYPMIDALRDQPMKKPGATGSLVMRENATGAGFEKFLCLAKGTIDAKGAMDYFDPSRGRNVGISCTSTAVSAPVGYWHAPSNRRASCYFDGTIDFGDRVTSKGSTEPGPTLYVDNKSCIWANKVTGAEDDWGSCAWQPNKNLVRVKILPEGLEISGYVNANKIITCSN